MSLTENQRLAVELLGYLPAGYIMVAEDCRANPLWRRVGAIHVRGKCVFMFDASDYLRAS